MKPFSDAVIEEVTYGLLLRKLKGEEQEKDQLGEDLLRGRVVDLSRLPEKQHSA